MGSNHQFGINHPIGVQIRAVERLSGSSCLRQWHRVAASTFLTAKKHFGIPKILTTPAYIYVSQLERLSTKEKITEMNAGSVAQQGTEDYAKLQNSCALMPR